MFRKFGGKWGTECHNTKLPLPTCKIQGEGKKRKKNTDKQTFGSIKIHRVCQKT